MLTDGPPGVGTRWRERTWGLGTFTIQVVEFEPPRRFAEATVGGETDLSLEFDLSTVGTGSTLIHLEARGSLSGWRAIPQRWLEPFMGRLIRRDLERAARR